MKIGGWSIGEVQYINMNDKVTYKNRLLNLFAAMLFLCSSQLAVGQTMENVLINGLVLSKDKCPLPDVRVHVADSEIEVRTDSEGRFSFDCPLESCLTFWPDSIRRYDKSVCKLMRKPGIIEPEYTFILDYKTEQRCKARRLLNKVMLKKSSQTHYLIDAVAQYNIHIRAITLKLLERYADRKSRIGFIIDGNYYDLSADGNERFPEADLVLTDGADEQIDNVEYHRFSFDDFDTVLVFSNQWNSGYFFLLVRAGSERRR